MTFKTRFTTAIATGAVLVNALAPAAFANTITVSGNGAFSENAVETTSNSTKVVNQTNNANIANNVSSNASTGGNSSNFNTGGDSVIRTGNATSNTAITNAANVNKASLSNCGGCDAGPTTVNVSGNGAFSQNGVSVEQNKAVFLNQDNNANFVNNVNANANTGKNDNSFNTGGESIVVTGNATTNVSVNNEANKNWAVIGGGNGSNGGSSVTISGNGAFSENGVALAENSAVVLDQVNSANIANYVDAKANTGKNDATFNTGGFVGISTGDAKTNVAVDNKVNFNAASIDCDCVLDGLAVKIAGNGAESLNGVSAESNNETFYLQDNLANLLNEVDDYAKTGHNDVGFSTSDVDGDPLVVTGDAHSKTVVNNEGNENYLNEGGLVLPGGLELGLHWDLSSLLAHLSIWA